MSDIIIVAPHNDDEIIGNYMVLTNKNNSNIIIIYDGDTPQERREEALKLKEYFTNVKMQLFQKSIPQPLLNTENTFYFPDPVYERHPLHRQWGFMGEQMARQGFDVVFYSTNMNAPYIHEKTCGNMIINIFFLKGNVSGCFKFFRVCCFCFDTNWNVFNWWKNYMVLASFYH